MNRKIPFSEGELRVLETLPKFFGHDQKIRSTPVSSRENVNAMYFEKHPYWFPVPSDYGIIVPGVYNDTLGRGGVEGVTDVFGVEWEFIESAGGSIVRPGEPFMKNANEWRDLIKIPDVDAWDWAGAAEATKIDQRFSTQVSMINGFWFERLISFMDFAPAAVALIDEDQQDAVKALFEAMTDLAIKVIDKLFYYWPTLDGINIHDDWAAQKAPFFSMNTAYEMFVPYMKAVTDHIHAKGRYATLHSCGRGESRVQAFIDAGWDGWDLQGMNDTAKLWEDFGDKISISIVPEEFDPDATGKDEQYRRGQEFARRFSVPGKYGTISNYGFNMLTEAFTEGVYVESRKIYSK
ncbi:MAG: methyltransferase [Oscillospiraceae bacterium]|jgi:hypothetical protein|nr:methyltransferase [Oscillospiraceae bacterium]